MKSAGNAVIPTFPAHCPHGLQHLRRKRSTFAFTPESGYTLGSAQRIAHSGSHGETGRFPPPATAWSCAASEITLYAVFVTPDSAALLYTYISRFSENPHYQQQLYLRPSFFPIFNFSHKRPTFAFTGKSGYSLGFRRKIAHKGTHGETGAFRTGPLSLPSTRTARLRTSPGRVSERRTLPLLDLGRGYSRRTQRAFGTAMRLCASLSRGAAAPLGCVIFFRFCRNYGFHTLYSGLFACARRGWYHYPRHALHVLETLDGRLSKGRICRFLRSTDIIDSSGAKAETASHAEQLRFPAKGTGAVFYVTSWSVPGTRRSALLCKRRWDRTCRCPRRW